MVDLLEALKRRDLWVFLGWQDIKQRYRRSLIGPFWLTISTGVHVGTLGFLWAKLFGQSLDDYLPFFAIGQVAWVYLSGLMNEATTGFTQFESIIKQIRIPFSSMLLRLLWRHLIIFLHNSVIIVMVIGLVGTGWSGSMPLSLFGLFLLSLFGLAISGPIAILCTRFRDLPQIVASFLTVLFFLTPIMWKPESLRHEKWVFEYNPFFHLIEVLREPLLGRVPPMHQYLWVIGVIVIVGGAHLWMMGKWRNRIAFWL